MKHHGKRFLRLFFPKGKKRHMAARLAFWSVITGVVCFTLGWLFRGYIEFHDTIYMVEFSTVVMSLMEEV